jgi:hypothetical protein
LGAQTHALCVVDPDGKRIDRLRCAHSADGLQRLTNRLARHGAASQLTVAVERPDGRLVDHLLQAGHPVVAVKPNAIKAWRDAEVRSGAKRDPVTPRSSGDDLRLRRHQLRVLRPFGDRTRALRTVSAATPTWSGSGSLPPTSYGRRWSLVARCCGHLRRASPPARSRCAS